MSIFKKLFSGRGPEDYMSKGDTHTASHNYYEARMAYEAGLECCQGKAGQENFCTVFLAKIAESNRAMAELNLLEAEHALRRGAAEKAVEHLELAKTLTDDAKIREKAVTLLSGISEKLNDTVVLEPSVSCSSCSSCGPDEHVFPSESDTGLPILEHYDLLIHQLPAEMYERYSGLGEDFASMFISASQDNHLHALELLDTWYDGSDRDIYCYEKGKILHRLGKVKESEACLRESIKENNDNPLAHLGLALLLLDEHRFDEGGRQLDYMISHELLVGQAVMMRGEVYQLTGDIDNAMRLFGSLLDTSLSRAAAEKLHGILLENNRHTEAAHIFKRYLGKCQH